MRRPSAFVTCGLLLVAVVLVAPIWLTLDATAQSSPLWFQGGGSGLVIVALVWAGRASSRPAAALRAAGLWGAVEAVSVGLISWWTERANDALRDGYDGAAATGSGSAGGGLVEAAEGGLVRAEWERVYGWSELAYDIGFATLLAACGVLALELRRTQSPGLRRVLSLALCAVVGYALLRYEGSWVLGVAGVLWGAWSLPARPARQAVV